jgi:uncharacterized protein HemY
LIALIAAAAFVACGPSNAERARQDMASVQKETDAKTLVERGKAFAAVGDPTRAEEYLASGLDAGADPRDVLPLLMDVCVRTGRYRSAIQHGENHLRKHPRDRETRLMVGALYVALNEGKNARVQLESATESQRPHTQAEAHYLLGVLAREEGDVVSADRHFRAYLELAPQGNHGEEARASLLERVKP